MAYKEHNKTSAMLRNALIALIFAPALSTGASAIPEQIESCLSQNLPQSTAIQSVELRARDRSHYEQVLQADIFWKRFENDQPRVMMYFHEPADIRGARFLILGQQPQTEMFVYMPALFKVRRITSKQVSSSVMGTDFSYEDFERLQGIVTDLQAEQLPDELIGGRPVHVLHSHPDTGSGYTQIITYIDKETCIPLRTRLFEAGQQLRKEMSVDPVHIRQLEGISYPGELRMKDLRDKTETRLIIRKLTIGNTLDDDLFEADSLKQAHIPPVISR